MDDRRGYFWRGPITDPALANRIIRRTTIGFAILATFLTLSAIVSVSNGQANSSTLVVFGLMDIAVVALGAARSAIAAGFLFAASTIFLFGAAIIITAVASKGDPSAWLAAGVLLAIFVPAAVAALRAVRAARYLRKPPVAVEAFD